MQIKRCKYCGDAFFATRSDKVFCSSKCRVYYKRAGGPLAVPETYTPALRPPMPARPGEDDVAEAVACLREDAARLDAASVSGPTDTRALCRMLAGSVVAALEEVGL